MKIKEWSWRNICSYGNKLNTIKISDNPQLILVHGDNGAGKSSISEALTVSVYGRSVTRKMRDIPNRMNRNAYTNVIFESNFGDKINLERGIDPNHSNLTINEAPYNLPDKRRVDEFIEDQIVKIPLTVFANTINLSIDDFKSFIQLSPNDKRKVVDKIFGLDEINQMGTIIKEENRILKSEITVLETSLGKSKHHLQKSNDQLIEIRQNISDEKQKEITTLQKKVELAKEKQNKYKLAGSDANKVLMAKQDGVQEISDRFNQIRFEISAMKDRISLLESGKCSKCGTNLSDHDHKEELNQCLADVKLLTIDQTTASEHRTAAQAEVRVLSDEFEKFKKLFTQEGSNITMHKQRIDELQKQSNALGEVSTIENFIEQLKNEIAETEVEYFSKKSLLSVNQELEGALSDQGIKKIIMGNIIPILNQKLLKISKVLEFKFAFEFDEDFNPIIKHIGHEISADSLSSGEAKKMNLVVLLSMLEIIMMKQSGSNILFLDEIFTSLDNNSVYRVVEILKTFARKYRMTIFVVSHEWLPEEFFDVIMSVKNIDNFSEIETKAV